MVIISEWLVIAQIVVDPTRSICMWQHKSKSRWRTKAHAGTPVETKGLWQSGRELHRPAPDALSDKGKFGGYKSVLGKSETGRGSRYEATAFADRGANKVTWVFAGQAMEGQTKGHGIFGPCSARALSGTDRLAC